MSDRIAEWMLALVVGSICWKLIRLVLMAY